LLKKLSNANRQISDVYLWVINDYNKKCNYPLDLIQHVFLLVCEQDKDFIIQLATTGKLKGYVCKLLYNTNRWQRTEYSKQLAANEIPTENINDIADECYQEIIIPLHKIHWYKAEVLKIYAEIGNYRGVAEKTGIHHCSIFQTVKQAKNEIKRLL
jgi:hypothetical protein